MRQKDDKGRFVRQPMEDRFDEYVDRSGGPEACWLWTGFKTRAGYGRFTDYWDKHLAHRLAYQWAHGPIPEGMQVCHACDNPSCVNPAHLWVGTASDNMRDAVAKGRKGGPTGRPGKRGSTNGNSRITEADVIEIRRRYAAPKHWSRRAGAANPNTVRALAAEFGVSSSVVFDIVKRRVWTHV